MRVLLALLLIGMAGCGGGSSVPNGGAVPTPEGFQAKVDNSPAHTAPELKAVAKKSVEGRETLTLTLKGHSGVFGSVTSVSFSPDGKRIVSGSGDKTVKIWDISSLDTSK